MDSAYIICEADRTNGSCSLNALEQTFLGIGGTSASAPAFAGMMALVNQFTNSAGQGNANYVLYKIGFFAVAKSIELQRNQRQAPASGCMFNDVTSGTIAMPCANGSPNCSESIPTDSYGVLSGYNAGTGYDLATGLGSVNAYNLVHNWILPSNPTSTTLTINNGNPVSITHGQSVPLACYSHSRVGHRRCFADWFSGRQRLNRHGNSHDCKMARPAETPRRLAAGIRMR